MYLVSVNTGDWVEGSNTEIRVEFDDEAKADAENGSNPGEKLLDKCFWRLVYERWEEVQGASVSFRVDRRVLLGLIERLRVAEAETKI
ncbi:MAG: hypothetical protein ABSG00_07500 [Terracidiphilus sp.]|jgi:hypothetical protein